MADCKKYTDMISTYVDGELSESQEAELNAHMERCPDCRKVCDAFKSMSGAMGDELVSPPVSLAEGVMLRIASQEKTQKNKKSHIWSYLAAAACFALVIFGAWRIGFFGLTSADESSPENASLSADQNDGEYGDGNLDLELDLRFTKGDDGSSNMSGGSGEDGAVSDNAADGVLQFSMQRELLNGNFASNEAFMESEMERLLKADKITVYDGAFISGDEEYADSVPVFEAFDEKSRNELFELMTADMLLEYDDMAEELDVHCTLLFTGVKTDDGQAAEDITVTVWIYDDQLFFKLSGEPPVVFLSDTFPVDFEKFVEKLIKKQ